MRCTLCDHCGKVMRYSAIRLEVTDLRQSTPMERLRCDYIGPPKESYDFCNECAEMFFQGIIKEEDHE